MSKHTGSKCKLCRREGEKLFLKGDRCNTSKCAIVKRNYIPGIHGPKGRQRLTAYATQLRAKQRLKRLYGLFEKQFTIYFDKATAQKGDAGENFLKILEKRLDNAVHRAGLTPSRSQARQVVSHGHILVNGKKVNIPSYQVKAGDIISIRKTSENSPLFKHIENVSSSTLPGWITLDTKAREAKIVSDPDVMEFYEPLNIKLVVEYYSR